jgi:hypothetical protein
MSDLNSTDQKSPDPVTPMGHLRACLTPEEITVLFYSLGVATAAMERRNDDYSAGRVLKLINKLKADDPSVLRTANLRAGIRIELDEQQRIKSMGLGNIGPDRFELCRHDVIATECEQCKAGK